MEGWERHGVLGRWEEMWGTFIIISFERETEEVQDLRALWLLLPPQTWGQLSWLGGNLAPGTLQGAKVADLWGPPLPSIWKSIRGLWGAISPPVA